MSFLSRVSLSDAPGKSGKIASSLLAAVAMAASSGSISAEAVPASAHMDWQGNLITVSMADGSILHEYAAHSSSRDGGSAVFAISFVPRFECMPVISFSFNKSSLANVPTTAQVELLIDDQKMIFDSLADEESDLVRFSYNGGKVSSRELLDLIDVGSWATARLVLPESDSASDRNDVDSQATDDDATIDEGMELQAGSDLSGAISFSLLGSKKANLAVEQACKNHTPVPYSTK